MAIFGMFQVGQAGPYSDIGVALSALSRRQVNEFDGQRGIGFSYDSCNAAVAVTVAPATQVGYLDTPANLGLAGTINPPLHVVYGSSRLYAGLDPNANFHLGTADMCNPFSSSPRGQHAEQTAILLAEALGMTFWTDAGGHCHVYVDFTPCSNCEPWLRDTRTEQWVVHYGVPLAQKADFKRERQARHRVSNKDNSAHWKQIQQRRRDDAAAAGKAARLAMFNKSRGIVT